MSSIFVPAFDFQDWLYQSFLVLPTSDESAAAPGTDITAKKWAMGKLILSDSPAGYQAAGFLDFTQGARLKVSVEFTPGNDEVPANFEAIGIGEDGVTKGAKYELKGWAFAGEDGKVESVSGSVRAVRGPDSNPSKDLGGMPIGTVGAFVIKKVD